MRRLLLSYLIAFTSLTVTAQVASVQDGAWNNTNTWDCGCVPDFNEGQITISAFTTVTIPNGYTADADEILVDGDGTLTIESGGRLIVRDGTGDDLTVNIGDGFFSFDGILNVNSGGVLENRGQISSTNSNLLITGTYQHNLNGGTIPDANWITGSTLDVTGVTSTKPSGFGQSFYNVIWNCNQSGSVSLLGELTSIANDFTISNTGTNRSLILSTSTNGTLTVGNNLLIQNAAILAVVQSGSYTLNITGSLTVNSSVTNSLLFTATGTPVVNVSGNFTKSGTGTVNFASSSGLGTLNVTGDFSITGGTLTETSSGSGSVVFNGTGIQTFSNSGTIANTINFTVNNGTTVDFGTSALGGTGAFVCSGNVRLGSTNASGAVQGNIPLSTRTFNSGSSITYNGVAAQFMGFSTSSGVNSIINNASGVSLASSVTIGGNLTLTAGNLSVGNNTLTFGGNVTPNSNTIVVSSGSSLVINGSGAFGTFPFPSGAQTISNFTLNRTSTGSVVFGNDVTITGTVTLSNGDLNFSNRLLTLSGTFNSAGGFLFGNSSSTLSITGSGAFGTLAFSGSGNTINTLNFDRASSGTASLNSNLTVTTALNLLNGDFTNTSGLTLSNNAILTRNSTSQLLESAITMANGDRYNLVYTGTALSTGIEMPTVANDDLRNLTINGGPVTLTQSIIVNGDLTLQNSSLNGNGFDITMAGNPGIWNKQNGTFSPGSGTVIITGNISVQATSNPQFGNITTNSGATFTARAGIMNISGNLQLDGSSTFNHNNGTLTFNGSSTQGIASAGKSFNNITVTKGGGNLQILSTLNLVNTLSVTTATTVESGGNLVLISTSDGPSGNARIGTLPSGASVSGDVIAQRYMADEGRIYRYISSPLTNATVAQLQDDFPVTGSFTGASTGCSGCTTNSSMFYYDEATAGGLQSGYFQYPIASNTEILQPGRGYAPFVRDDIILGNVVIDLTGPINQGSVALPVAYTNNGDATADGYNLVGNPFPSSIDWDFVSGWTKTNISNVIAVRDNGAGGVFRYWDGSTGSFANGEIATGQGFWVRATAGSPSLVVNEQAKTTATATFYRGTEEEVDVLEILLTNGTLTDNAYLRLRSEASNALDEYDGTKLDNASFDMYTVSEDGIPMAINAVASVSCDTPMKLGIKDMPNGTFTFSRKALGVFTNYYVELFDKFTQTRVMLDESTPYQFTTNSNALSKAEDRFEITLTIQVPASAELVDNTLYSNYTTGNQWYRNGEPIEGATEPTFTPELSGEYSLSVTIGTCKSIATETFVITGSEEDELSRIRIYPNPTKGITKIEIRSSSQVTADIIDVMGRTMQGINVTKALDGFWTGSADLSHLKKGVYMVRVFDSARGLSYRRIVKE
jgi:hypothetical protein